MAKIHRQSSELHLRPGLPGAYRFLLELQQVFGQGLAQESKVSAKLRIGKVGQHRFAKRRQLAPAAVPSYQVQFKDQVEFGDF
ncbi:MAG: hypothetical protein ABJC13_02025 [Acidobacteriota bacterium]